MSIVVICVGACVGALLRWALSLWLNQGTVIPFGTLAANLIGCYLIGVAVAVFQALPHLDAHWRLGIITGFLGALTTFSSFSAEVMAMLEQQRCWLGFGTASMHLFGSLLLTWAGIQTVLFFMTSP